MKVLVLCHPDLIPPDKKLLTKHIESRPWRTEAYVARALRLLGHQVTFCGVDHSWRPLERALQVWAPDLVFNLLEEFMGEALLEPLVTAKLQALGVPFTGCSAVGLVLAKNKIAAKTVLSASGVTVPGAEQYPKIVKYQGEESSRGISQSSIVRDQEQEQAIIKKLKMELNAAVFSEEYIAGRELHVSVLVSGGQVSVAPVWETTFGQASGHKILSEKLKWNFSYRKKMGVRLRRAVGLKPALARKVQAAARNAVLALEVDGPARVDIRLNSRGEPYVIEVNPNPDLAQFDEFAVGMRSLGISYVELIDQICKAGLRRRPTP